MIIDGNNFNKNNSINMNQSFNNQNINNQQKVIPTNNAFVTDMAHQKYTNPNDNKGMSDRALSILHERLRNGTITLEEFNKKCNAIGKNRQNQ